MPAALASPWPELDKRLTIRPGDLIAITGPGSSGVSMAALNFAIHAAFELDSHAEVFSLEISSGGTMERVLANRARVDSTHLAYPERITDDEQARIDAIREQASGIPLRSISGPLTVDTIRIIATEHAARSTPLRLAVVDGLQHVGVGLPWSIENTARAARGLKKLAVALDLVMVVTVHLDFEGSGRKRKWGVDAEVVDAADVLLVLQPEDEGKVAVHVAKGGNTQPSTVFRLAWDPRYSQFTPLDEQPTGAADEVERAWAGWPGSVSKWLDDSIAAAKQPPLATPWPEIDELLRLEWRGKAGIIAQRGSHEATAGRRIAAHVAQTSPVLLFTGFPPSDPPANLVINQEAKPTPEMVGDAAARMIDSGMPPALIVIERFERMQLDQRDDIVSRADELEQCVDNLVRVDGVRFDSPLLITTAVDGEPETEARVMAWAGVDSPSGVMTDVCRRLLVLRRLDDATVRVRIENDSSISPQLLSSTVSWQRPKGSKAPRQQAKAAAVAAPVPPAPARTSTRKAAAGLTISGAIQALETAYAGHRFRSRLEARWAVFFDALGIQWEYEPERYQLPSGKYLPDFWLPKQRIYYEVKGVAPTESYVKLLDELATGTGSRVVLAVGSIPSPDRADIGAEGLSDFWMEVYDGTLASGDAGGVSEAAWDNYQSWTQCAKCGAFDVCFEGRGCRTYCGCSTGNCNCGDVPAAVLEGFRAARSARFEHGESGA